MTAKDRALRRETTDYRKWRFSVYARDQYTCQACGYECSGQNIAAHHLAGYAEYPKLRLARDNGITLCSKCHLAFHSAYGKHNITRAKFNRWLAQRESA